jgi:hypothetical protein
LQNNKQIKEPLKKILVSYEKLSYIKGFICKYALLADEAFFDFIRKKDSPVFPISFLS